MSKVFRVQGLGFMSWELKLDPGWVPSIVPIQSGNTYRFN